MGSGMEPNPGDIALLHRLSQQDPQALSELYDRFSRLVFSVALKILATPEAAEEVTQDVFIQIWQKAASYNPSQGRLITWIASIARNRAIDHYRRTRVRPEGNSIAWEDCCDDSSDGAPGIEPNFIDADQRRVLLLAINTLPADQKAALSLAYFSGLNHQQIAAQLHEPLGTIKTRIRLAMQKLRSAMLDGTESPR
jgi:RNA polymerase sigma-70 factor (ECF subfamily)